MPPYRPNPISRARSEFFDEPMEPEFFVPVGRGSTSFGEYISPGRAASSRRRLEEFSDYQDERATKGAERFNRRLELGSRNRTLPYTEAAGIATAKLAKERAESDSRLNPFLEDERRVESRLHTAQGESGLETLPGDVAARTEMRDLALADRRAQDSFAEDLRGITKDPAHHRAYRHFLQTAPAPLKDENARREYAFNKALALAEDQEGVDAAYEAFANQEIDENTLQKYLEPVESEDQRFGERIRPEARNHVRALVHNSRNKRLLAQERRDMMRSDTARDTQLLVTLDKMVDNYRSQLKDDGGNDELKKRLRKAEDQLEAAVNRLHGDNGSSAPQKSSGKSEVKALID